MGAEAIAKEKFVSKVMLPLGNTPLMPPSHLIRGALGVASGRNKAALTNCVVSNELKFAQSESIE